jgi:hypothetical protein
MPLQAGKLGAAETAGPQDLIILSRYLSVKHVTVNADQAVVTDSIVTGENSKAACSAKVLATVTDNPTEILEAEKQKETMPVEGGVRNQNDHQPHAKGPCCPSMYSQIKADFANNGPPDWRANFSASVKLAKRQRTYRVPFF